MQTIQIDQYFIDIHNNSGIMLSGGADSAILFYIVLKYSKTPVKVYTLASAEKHRANINITKNLIEYCVNELNIEKLSHHIVYEPKQKDQLLFTDAMKDLVDKRIDILYTAITKCPPVEVTDQFIETNSVTDDRNPNVVHAEYLSNKKIYRPLVNLDKQDIRNLYSKLGLLDTLFPLTRSCESLDLTSGHCGRCWWCEERQWAFGRLE